MKPDELAALDGNDLDGLVFCAQTYALFEQIRRSPDGTSRLRRRPSRLEKRLLEELLPICKYVQHAYRPGRYIKVRWIDGSQSFDAELVQFGPLVDQGYYPAKAFLEVICIVHPKEHMKREHLDKRGGTFGLEGLSRNSRGEIESSPIVYTNRKYIEVFRTLVLHGLAKKSKKSYPTDTSLVVQCSLNTVYTPAEWSELMLGVEAESPASAFREIFFYDVTHHYSYTIHPRQ